LLILPAIDLLDGNAVRLKKGAEATRKIYSNKPSDVAEEWEKSGAKYIHVVNLDGAFGRNGVNTKAVDKILESISVPIELGGGIRSLEDARIWLNLGVDRIIFGTTAITSPDVIEACIGEFGAENIVVGIDARNSKVAINGWEKQTEKSVIKFALSMKKIGVIRIIYTDIDRDGLLTGPNIKNTCDLARQTQMKVIASGGVSTMEHIQNLVDTNVPEIDGAIIGTALYEKQIDLKEVIEKFQ
jgi:phosphoribosylformimino-5-aminoimidazole carboxamide ribotide isomerase